MGYVEGNATHPPLSPVDKIVVELDGWCVDLDTEIADGVELVEGDWGSGADVGYCGLIRVAAWILKTDRSLDDGIEAWELRGVERKSTLTD